MPRAALLVMDSVGCGGAPDAAAFGDEGANTLGHIAQACAEGRAEQGRSGPLRVPNLAALGLGPAIRAASGIDLPGFDGPVGGVWAAATGSRAARTLLRGTGSSPACRCLGTGTTSRAPIRRSRPT
jgi:phosphopentomutase